MGSDLIIDSNCRLIDVAPYSSPVPALAVRQCLTGETLVTVARRYLYRVTDKTLTNMVRQIKAIASALALGGIAFLRPIRRRLSS